MSEQKDYIDVDIRRKGVREQLRQQLNKVEAEHTKARKPFCFQAGKSYYEELVESKLKTAASRENGLREGDLKIPTIDFNQFGDIKKFKKISETRNVEKVKQGNIVIEVEKVYDNYIWAENPDWHISVERVVEDMNYQNKEVKNG